jgi:hypothetical protein
VRSPTVLRGGRAHGHRWSYGQERCARGSSSSTAIRKWTQFGGVATDAATAGAIPRIRVTRRIQRLRPRVARASRASSLQSGRPRRDRAGLVTRQRNLRGFRSRLGLTYPVLADEARAAYRAYGLGRGSWRRVWGVRTMRAYWRLLRVAGGGRACLRRTYTSSAGASSSTPRVGWCTPTVPSGQTTAPRSTTHHRAACFRVSTRTLICVRERTGNSI